MRKILAATLTTIATFIAVVVAAQPAVADDPGAVPWSYYGANYAQVGCTTPYRVGVLGQYGAWGYYIDGCTARAVCPNYARLCLATGTGTIQTYARVGHRVTLNGRLRAFAPGATAPYWWLDASCAGTNSCTPYPALSVWLYPNQSATEQCNGVRQPASNTASVRCQVTIQYYW